MEGREAPALPNRAVKADARRCPSPAELERLRKRVGARLLIVAWPAFWWLDHYVEFHRHVVDSFACVTRNEQFIVFELTEAPNATGRGATA